MTRDEVILVIKKHLGNTIDGLDVSRVEPTQSMRDLGANSLDIVEVVSATMRELKVKIPRAELSKLANLGDLAELIVRTHAAREAPDARSGA